MVREFNNDTVETPVAKIEKGNKFLVKADWLPRVSVCLEHQSERVWPLVLHWDKWINDCRVDHVSGPPNQVGEVKKITPLGQMGDEGSGGFSIEIVRVIEREQLISKYLPLEAPSGPFCAQIGYEVFNLRESNGRTYLTYETIAELQTEALSQNECEAVLRDAYTRAYDGFYKKYIPELQRLLSEV